MSKLEGNEHKDEKEIQYRINGLVCQSVEETLNTLLNAEADAICSASRVIILYPRKCAGTI